ncbi:hypothetical protein DPMN_040053 [Dreissena polymorpha]|uniref:Uncharacterized protein n=1 Tax=Dreissena polymorpha TaxID=45954 RepID=A0A9D4CUC4_DREPO|nr:hypothetical protein DPMN_040053 [Dreissena polymorpha]
MFRRRVGMGDDDSGLGSMRLLSRQWTDLLSCAARGWMRVRLSREASAAGGSGRGRLRVRAGVWPARLGCACAGAAYSALWELRREATAFYD